MPRYKYTQESGTDFKVVDPDKADAQEDTNEERQILDDLGNLLGHSKRDDLYPKDGTTGGNLAIPESQLNISNVVFCSDYDHPDDAITAIGASDKTLLVTESEVCDVNFTVPANVTVKFERGGKWTINNGITVTFNGQIEAGLWQIFAYTGTGVLAGDPDIDRIFPEWFGALRDGSTNDSTAIQNALDFALATKHMIFFTAGTYKCTNLKLKDGWYNGLLQGSGKEQTILENTTTTPILTDDGQSLLRVTIKDMYFKGVTTTGEGIKFTAQVYESLFENIKGYTGGASISLTNASCFSNTFINIHASSYDNHAFLLNAGHSTLIECYAHNAPATKAGFRILRGDPTLIGCNGVDSAGYWGTFGSDNAEDGFIAYVFPTLIKCNVEDFSNTGLRFKSNSTGIFNAVSVLAPSSGTVIGLLCDSVNSSRMQIGYIRFDTKGASWQDGYAIHSSGVPYMAIGTASDLSYQFKSGVNVCTVYGISYNYNYLRYDFDITGIPTIGVIRRPVVTIADGDATPDVSGGEIFVTSANTGATEITDLDNPIAGQIVTIIGGSDTNPSTITDGGNFKLAGNITLSLNTGIKLFVQADNNYIEICRNITSNYKEGEWTPVLDFGGNSVGIEYSVQAGLYTKVGRLVTITAKIALTSKGTSTGVARITGLPFACKNADGAYSAGTVFLKNITFANAFQAVIDKGNAIFYIREITEGGAVTMLYDTNYANNSEVVLSGTYFTD